MMDPVTLGMAKADAKKNYSPLGQFELQPMVAIGHSYIGQNNQTPGARAHERVASRLRMGTISNFGAPGKYSRQVAMNTLGGTNKWVPGTRALFYGICTINDIQLHGDDPRAFTGYKHAWRSILSLVTSNGAVAANTNKFVYSGGWTKNNVTGTVDDCSTGGAYYTTSTVGEYFEFTFTGTDVDVVMISKSVAAGIVTFTEGATNLGTLDMTSACMGNTPTIFKIRGRSTGTHTIRGTLTSGASATVDSYRIPATQPVPGVVVGEGQPNRTAPGSTPYSTLLTRNLDALKVIVAEYPSMVFADARVGFDQAAMLREDLTHPNDYGCAHYATVARAALQKLPYSQGLNILVAAEPAYVAPAGPSVPAGGFDGSSGPAPLLVGGTFLDNFNRANSTTPGNLETGQAWSIAGASTTWGITSNRMGALTGGNSFLNVDTGAADGTVTGVVGAVGALNAGLGFRGVDEANMWYVAYGASTAGYVLNSRTSGTLTGVAVTTQVPIPGDIVEVVLAGSSIIVKVNGVEIINYTSSTRTTATKHGFYGNGSLASNSTWDGFKFTP